MQILVTGEQMKQLDQATIQTMGIPSLVLMERAALAVFDCLKQHFSLKKTLVVCGSGNNGADGMAVARLLHLAGYSVDLYLAGNPASFTEEMKIQWQAAENYQVSIVNNCRFSEYTTIVDALFGVGLSRELSGKYQTLVDAINASGVPVLAVDIPSGIHAGTGQVMGTAVRAAETVTFAYRKLGISLYPGTVYAGNVQVKDVGIYGASEGIYALDKEAISWLPARDPGGNKGTFGKVLLIAGSRNMSGAAYFSSKAALVSGAGMVRILTDESNRTILQQQFPEAMLSVYDSSMQHEKLADVLKKAMDWADVIAIGPGLSTSKTAEDLLQMVLTFRQSKPIVMDADALNLLAKRKDLQSQCDASCILTPHMGEMSRLADCTIGDLKAHPQEAMETLYRQCPCTLIMKDARTWIRTADGVYYLNLTGNQGMATAGSGDVLCGITAGLLAQGMRPSQAAPFAAWLHGLAGDHASQEKGARSMTASDILSGLCVQLQMLDWKIARKEDTGENNYEK